MTQATTRTETPAPAPFVDVAAVTDIEPEEPFHVTVEGTSMLLVRVGVEVFAIADTCTHETARLDTGFVEDGCIECPRHGAKFDLRSGAALTLPATRGLPRFPVRLEDGRVFVSPQTKA